MRKWGVQSFLSKVWDLQTCSLTLKYAKNMKLQIPVILTMPVCCILSDCLCLCVFPCFSYFEALSSSCKKEVHICHRTVSYLCASHQSFMHALKFTWHLKGFYCHVWLLKSISGCKIIPSTRKNSDLDWSVGVIIAVVRRISQRMFDGIWFFCTCEHSLVRQNLESILQTADKWDPRSWC